MLPISSHRHTDTHMCVRAHTHMLTLSCVPPLRKIFLFRGRVLISGKVSRAGFKLLMLRPQLPECGILIGMYHHALLQPPPPLKVGSSFNSLLPG